MKMAASNDLLKRIKELENRLEESEQLIQAIRNGEVDAFAIGDGKNSEVYTLQTGDYAYRILVEEFAEGALNVSEDGLVVYTNSYFCKLLGLSDEKLLGKYFIDLVHPDSADTFGQIFALGLSKGKSKGEIRLKGPRSSIPVYISLTSLQPKLPTIGIIITDLSRQKEHEKTILKYQAELEANNHKLTQNNAELASFAYIASHDMQEPLRKIQTFATRLIDMESERLSNVAKDHLRRMQTAASRMQALIEDLLIYSRTNAVERKYEDTDLNTIVDEVKNDMTEELQVKNAVVKVDEMCRASVIPFQFRQLLYNLLSNSLKFARPGIAPIVRIAGKVAQGRKLKVAGLSENLDYCHISISDNGIGFEQQYSKRIFELFQRLHGRTEFKGTGIGLAIVKKIVDNHNGIITAHSEPDKGATFDIYIPA